MTKVFLSSISFGNNVLVITCVYNSTVFTCKVDGVRYHILIELSGDVDVDFLDNFMLCFLNDCGVHKSRSKYIMSNISLTIVDHIPFLGFTNLIPDKLIKIESLSMSVLKHINSLFTNKQIRTFHSNWSPGNQFLHTSRLHLQSYMEISGLNMLKSSKSVHLNNLRPVAPKDEVMPLAKSIVIKVVAISNDAVTTQNTSFVADPHNEKDKIVCIAIYSHIDVKIFTILPDFKYSNKSMLCCHYAKECDLISSVINCIKEIDPTYILYFEDDIDDIYYLQIRSKGEFTKKTSRFDFKRTDDYKSYTNSHNNITGRCIINVKTVLKRSPWFNLSSFRLRDVIKSSRVLNPPKSDEDDETKHIKLATLFKDGKNGWSVIFDSIISDAKNINYIESNLSIITEFRNIAKVSDTNVQDTINRGEQIRVFNRFTRECQKRGYYINDGDVNKSLKFSIHKKPVDISDPPEHQINIDLRQQCKQGKAKLKQGVTILEGGNVMKPSPKFWEHEQIGILDFKSLYPSIMIAYNISYETVVIDNRYANLKGVNYLSVQINESETVLVAQVKNSIIPTILCDLITERDLIKKRMKSETDAFRISVLDKAQNSMKIFCNATYGFCGASGQYAILPMKPIMYIVTAIGRFLQKKCSYELAEKFGVFTLYGDTDSIFVMTDIQGVDIHDRINFIYDKFGIEPSLLYSRIKGIRIEHIANRILYYIVYEHFCKILSDMFSDPVLLEFENLADRMWMSESKKYYCYRKWDPHNASECSGMKIIGMASKKREYNTWTRMVLHTVTIMIVLQDNREDKIEDFIRNELSKLVDGHIKKKDLILSKEYLGNDQYKNDKHTHVQVVHKLESMKRCRIQAKSRISYLIVKGHDKIYRRACIPDEVSECQIDILFNIQNQLYKPLKKLLMYHSINIDKIFDEYINYISMKNSNSTKIKNSDSKVKKMSMSELIRKLKKSS